MSDNEFDHIFSENLKNARSIIDPEEDDWHDLASKLDHFQSRRRNGLKYLPWLLLPFLFVYAVWNQIALNKLKQADHAVHSQTGEPLKRDTLILDRKIYMVDTLYKTIYIYKNNNAAESLTVKEKQRPTNQPDNLTFQEDHATVIKSVNKRLDTISPAFDTEFVNQKPKAEEVLLPEEEKKEARVRKFVGFSSGILVPFGLTEIKNPLAFQISAELPVLAGFSIVPSLIYGQYLFENEDMMNDKIMVSTTNNPQGSFTLNEIKGMERIIIPSISMNYSFLDKNRYRLYSGIGLGVKINLPTQLEYEFLDVFNNNSYKYKQVIKMSSSQIFISGNLGGVLQIKRNFSVFGEARIGLSKGKEIKVNALMTAMGGIRIQF
jgi:hypothetical protein